MAIYFLVKKGCHRNFCRKSCLAKKNCDKKMKETRLGQQSYLKKKIYHKFVLDITVTAADAVTKVVTVTNVTTVTTFCCCIYIYFP